MTFSKEFIKHNSIKRQIFEFYFIFKKKKLFIFPRKRMIFKNLFSKKYSNSIFAWMRMRKGWEGKKKEKKKENNKKVK